MGLTWARGLVGYAQDTPPSGNAPETAPEGMGRGA